MAVNEILDLLMFATLCAAILIGFPVAFTLAGVSLLFALIGSAFGVFNLSILGAFPQRIFGTMTNQVLIAVPLFIAMGVLLERSKVAEQLLESMTLLFGRLRGGLGISVCIVGALMAASTGIVGATVVTMGLMALPTMLRHRYDPALAAGTISAAGTLGQIIPPSIVLILLGDVLASSYQQAQLDQGIFSPETIAVGDLFAGALIPGLCLVGLYLVYQILTAWLRPAAMPALSPDDIPAASVGRIWRYLFSALVPPIALIFAVLGSILGGIATPTEAASVGAVGALLLAGLQSDGARRGLLRLGVTSLVGLVALTVLFDLRVTRSEFSVGEGIAIGAAVLLTVLAAAAIAEAIRATIRSDVLQPVMRNTAELTAMVFAILIGAALFAVVFRGLGGDETIRALLEGLPGGVTGAMIVVMATIFVLGFFLDFIEITLVVVPLVAPALMIMGVDPIWLGIMIALNLQTSFLTPPFGFALFYLRGVAPASVRTSDIYRGVMPFIAIQIVALIGVAAFPALATWLPSVLF
ncbi:TRAP transporter large permease subunit [Fodinicurvata sp. EGI_FJ10296]|uniref:TRAP transporter large permease n=1 Tax=Fodinicurvata sp. EGI_FJ10296 TaxID=3231908 RepID=UPI003455016B